MAFDRRKMQAMLHERKFEIEGPPLPPEMALLRRQAEARRMVGNKPTLFLASMMLMAHGTAIK